MRKFDRLFFGTAGIPISTHGNTADGVKQVRKLGLDAMEAQFSHGITISEKTAPEVKKAAEENNVIISCHAPYYLNLNAKETEKAKASVKRILVSAERIAKCNGYAVIFHPGYNMGMESETVYNNIKKRIKEIVSILKNKGIEIWLRPETTGRATQFGELKELCRLSQEIENVMPCIDYAHMHARQGKNNTKQEFRQMLELIEKTLGKTGLNNMHCHVEGIAYGEKGEKHHLNLKDSDLNYRDLIKTWKEFKIKGVVISESPNIEGDALLMQKLYRK